MIVVDSAHTLFRQKKGVSLTEVSKHVLVCDVTAIGGYDTVDRVVPSASSAN